MNVNRTMCVSKAVSYQGGTLSKCLPQIMHPTGLPALGRAQPRFLPIRIRLPLPDVPERVSELATLHHSGLSMTGKYIGVDITPHGSGLGMQLAIEVWAPERVMISSSLRNKSTSSPMRMQLHYFGVMYAEANDVGTFTKA